MSSLFVLLHFAVFVHFAVSLSFHQHGWLQWFQRPLCSLLRAHNIHEWEQSGCAHDDSTSWTTTSPSFPSKPLFSLSSTKTSQITQKSHTMVVCLQGLAKDHKEMKRQQHTSSQLNREGYGMNYFTRLLGLIGGGPNNNDELFLEKSSTTAEEAAMNAFQTASFAMSISAEDGSTVQHPHLSTSSSLSSLDHHPHLTYDDDSTTSSSSSSSFCADEDERVEFSVTFSGTPSTMDRLHFRPRPSPISTQTTYRTTTDDDDSSSLFHNNPLTSAAAAADRAAAAGDRTVVSRNRASPWSRVVVSTSTHCHIHITHHHISHNTTSTPYPTLIRRHHNL